MNPLLSNLTDRVLYYLQIDPATPSVEQLNDLIHAYTRSIPWESAFLIAKRTRTQQTVDCPCWPDEFWSDAMTMGGGGTCFESNYAFLSLLHTLGYEGYLTINNMGESIACHTAIVIRLEGQRWLVDVGIPLYTVLLIDPNQPTQQTSSFHTYTLRPNGENIYQVERDLHPKPNCFTFIDQPISDSDYRASTTADYDLGGHFLDRVIIHKVIDDRVWRFASWKVPHCLESFKNGERTVHVIDGETTLAIAQWFDMNRETVERSLKILDHRY